MLSKAMIINLKIYYLAACYKILLIFYYVTCILHRSNFIDCYVITKAGETATRILKRYGYYKIINSYKENHMIDPNKDD